MGSSGKSVFYTCKFFVCSLLAMQLFTSFYLKKILFDTSNRSKIFQIVFEIQQIYQNNTQENVPDLVQKLSEVAFGPDLVHFLGFIFFVNLLYFKNYLEYFSSVWSVKKDFFQIKCWKHLHGRKAAHKKITGVKNRLSWKSPYWF